MDMVDRTQTPETKGATAARQGSRGFRVLLICAVSTGAAIIIAMVGHWLLIGSAAEETTQPLPRMETPAGDT